MLTYADVCGRKLTYAACNALQQLALTVPPSVPLSSLEVIKGRAFQVC
jgi:hypothetical protein